VSRRDAPSQEQITHLARRLIETYAWQAVSAQWIVERVTQRLASRPAEENDPALLIRWCEQAASEALYKACAAPMGRAATTAEQARLEAGYQDLGNYLIRNARLLRAPLGGLEPADLVQATLVAVHQSHEECQHPAQFLAWATHILYNLGRSNWREHERAAADTEPDPARRTRPRPAAARAYANPLGDQEVLRILHDCLDTDEERTLALCIIFGLKRRELGIVFDKPLAHFDELGRRVKRKLRKCGSFRDLFIPPTAWSGGEEKETVDPAAQPETPRARLRAWVWEAPTAAPTAPPEYARYQALLSAALADMLDRGGDDYRWFLDYLDQCASCEAEYEELAAVLAAARAAWTGAGVHQAPETLLPFPQYAPGEQRAVAEDRASWDAPTPDAGESRSRFPRYDLTFLREDRLE
jgi:DNA-directed RNA polymerase specialized sigma24 family protein